MCVNESSLGSDEKCKYSCIWCESHREVQAALQGRGWQSFPVKGQIVNISGFVGHLVSATTTYLLLGQKSSLS